MQNLYFKFQKKKNREKNIFFFFYFSKVEHSTYEFQENTGHSFLRPRWSTEDSVKTRYK